MSLLSELKRRHVIRVAVAYLAVAWLLAQVADVVLGNLGAPVWIIQTILWVLLIGFPIAVLFAWAYALTPAGIMRESDIDAEANDGAPPTGTRIRRGIAWSLSVAICALLAAGLGFNVGGIRDRLLTDTASSPINSLAVLPLDNQGAEDYEYFSDGLTEQLINQLVRLPALKVAPRTSSFYFKDRDELPRTIADLLDVRYLLDGSVRLSGDELRVDVQLIDAHSGFSIWSQPFVRERGEVFSIQDDIVLEVVDLLQLTLGEGARSAVTHRSTNNVAAQDLYWRARYRSEAIDLASLDEAIRLYERATTVDPDYAAAYVAWADAVFWRQQLAQLHPQSGWREDAHDLLDRALEIDGGLAEAYAVRSQLFQIEYDCDAAEEALGQAESLAPESPYVLLSQSIFYRSCGWPPERVLEYSLRAAAADPLNVTAAIQVSIAHYHLNEYEAALREADRVLARYPQEFWVAHWLRHLALTDLGRHEEALAAAKRTVELNSFSETRTSLSVAYANVGDTDEAQRIFAELDNQSNDSYWDPSSRAEILMVLNQPDAALAALEQAYADRSGGLPARIKNKRFLPFHGRPRFEQLVDRVGQRRRMERLYQSR